MGDELLIYGSYGYAGALIARTAVDEGMTPILAGRHPERVEEQALDLGLDHRVFTLEHPEAIEEQVEDVSAVLNCAGPFANTAKPLYSACLRAGTDYLDICGQIDVLEAIAERDRDAEKADVTLLPAVGFDVVPTDCLAAHLEARLPSATRLTIAMDGLGTFAPGTVKSIIDGFDRPGAIRRDGQIRAVPMAWRTRRVDFGQGPRAAVTVPWGDVSTAYYSTGIPNIEVYTTVPDAAASVMKKTRGLTPLLRASPVRRLLKGLADVAITGPTAEERAQSVTRMWGEVENDEGETATTRLRTPDTYDVTKVTAVEAARRTISGEVGPGYQTPASAFGPDFILEFDGVERVDLEEGYERVGVAE